MMGRALLYNSANKLSLYDKLFPWDYYLVAREFIKEKTAFVNLAGNFTEKLLENKYSPSIIREISGTEPSLAEALINAGAKIYGNLNEIDDNSLNLITSRFAPINLKLVKSKLKKGGHLIAEEIGFASFESIAYTLDMEDMLPSFNSQNNLENRKQLLLNEGFRVVKKKKEDKKNFLNKAELAEFISALSVFFDKAKLFESKLKNSEKDNFSVVLHRYIYTAKKLN